MISEQSWIWYLFLGSENPANIKGSPGPAANRLSPAIDYHLNESCTEGKSSGTKWPLPQSSTGAQAFGSCCQEQFLSGQRKRMWSSISWNFGSRQVPNHWLSMSMIKITYNHGVDYNWKSNLKCDTESCSSTISGETTVLPGLLGECWSTG